MIKCNECKGRKQKCGHSVDYQRLQDDICELCGYHEKRVWIIGKTEDCRFNTKVMT